MPLVLARPTCTGLWSSSHPFIPPSPGACFRPFQSSWARPPSVDAGSFALPVDMGLSLPSPSTWARPASVDAESFILSVDVDTSAPFHRRRVLRDLFAISDHHDPSGLGSSGSDRDLLIRSRISLIRSRSHHSLSNPSDPMAISSFTLSDHHDPIAGSVVVESSATTMHHPASSERLVFDRAHPATVPLLVDLSGGRRTFGGHRAVYLPEGRRPLTCPKAVVPLTCPKAVVPLTCSKAVDLSEGRPVRRPSCR